MPFFCAVEYEGAPFASRTFPMASRTPITLALSSARSSRGLSRFAASFSAFVLLNTVLIAGRPIRSIWW